MHSSLINKIRILKPRKKAPSQQNSKSFTIRNDNYHSTLVPSTQNDDTIPPLEPPKSVSSEPQPNPSWVPFYVVGVSQMGNGMKKLSVSESGTNEASTSQANDVDSSIQGSSNKNTLTKAILNPPDIKDHAQDSAPLPAENVISEEKSISGGRVTRQRSSRSSHSVNCFLCPTQFHSVQEMQDHYLESHKHKKRTGSNSTKSVTKKANKSSRTRIQDPLKLTEGDCSTGDGEPKCPICSIYFKTKEEVRNHMTSVHCYKCSECHNSFYTLYQFTDHRCAKFVKQKKPKLKKKKLKAVSSKESSDPLTVNPRKPVKTIPKIVPLVSNEPTYSLNVSQSLEGVGQPVSCPDFDTEPQSKSSTIKVTNDLTLPPSAKGDTASTLENETAKSKKSLLDYSLEELTSAEFNKIKLDEIIKNPHLSINWIPKKKCTEQRSCEFFSCGRCNVLCEDDIDYIDHLEECLRLSNVSIFSTNSPPKRILKLRSQILSSSPEKSAKTVINKRLLQELRGFMGTKLFDSFNSQDENIGPSETKPLDNYKSDIIHPDIKGNISIVKLKKSVETHTLGSPKQSQAEIPAPMLMTKSSQYPTSSATTQQPMVIIPLSNSHPGYGAPSTTEATPGGLDYPNISITDKSNSVTWNFIGSEKVLRMDTALVESYSENGKIITESVKDAQEDKFVASQLTSLPIRKEGKNPTNVSINFGEQKLEFPAMKSEPDSPHGQDQNVDTCMELILDEEEIKMEVEDEILDDKF